MAFGNPFPDILQNRPNSFASSSPAVVTVAAGMLVREQAVQKSRVKTWQFARGDATGKAKAPARDPCLEPLNIMSAPARSPSSPAFPSQDEDGHQNEVERQARGVLQDGAYRTGPQGGIKPQPHKEPRQRKTCES